MLVATRLLRLGKNSVVFFNRYHYIAKTKRGKVRNGAVYMPPFEGTFNQEAMWAIKAYLETRREKPLP